MTVNHYFIETKLIVIYHNNNRRILAQAMRKMLTVADPSKRPELMRKLYNSQPYLAFLKDCDKELRQVQKSG